MAFFTRPTLTDEQFKQLSTSVLTLSGETNFVGILKSKGVEIDASTGGTFAGYVLTLDPTGVIKLKPSSSGGTGVYDAASPSTINVGGIPAGTTLTGRTFESLWEQLLVVYQEPAFNTFGNNISSLNQVGNPASWSGNKIFTWSTSNSSNVQPNTIEIKDVTSGNVVLGTGLANDGVESLPLLTTITNNTPVSHTWNIVGTNTELNSIPVKTYNIQSIYPWFYGTFDGGAVPAGVNRPDASIPATAQALIDAGTVVVQKSNGTLSVGNFGATAQDYIWFAIPTTSTAKTVWYVDVLNSAAIGGAVSPGGNLFPDPDTTAIDSPSAYWSGISYNIYVSNKQVATTNMEFRNS